jgi:hypothetical protein
VGALAYLLIVPNRPIVISAPADMTLAAAAD